MDEETMQQIQQLVVAAMNGDQQATQLIQQIYQKAQSGDQQATQLIQVIQQVAQQMQGQQVQAARRGAKINYIRFLRGKCPEGYEVKYFKAGGKLCKKCVAKKKSMQAGGDVEEQNVIKNFKDDHERRAKVISEKMKEREAKSSYFPSNPSTADETSNNNQRVLKNFPNAADIIKKNKSK